jgi:hypothetical protein
MMGEPINTEYEFSPSNHSGSSEGRVCAYTNACVCVCVCVGGGGGGGF